MNIRHRKLYAYAIPKEGRIISVCPSSLVIPIIYTLYQKQMVLDDNSLFVILTPNRFFDASTSHFIS